MSTKLISRLAPLLMLSTHTLAGGLPNDFVELHSIAPSIRYDIRYANNHNFVGRPITGYKRARCLLTKPTALALAKVQTELLKSNLSLMVYDCYRPQKAVNDFIVWSKVTDNHIMKPEFYPQVNKRDFFKLGYVAKKSGHSRGSTVDLTIIPTNLGPTQNYSANTKLVACYAPFLHRFDDGSLDMGTGFDCMDPRSFPSSKKVSITAYHNRMILRDVMMKYGFTPYAKEWWHFTLKDEPYPNTYFNQKLE